MKPTIFVPSNSSHTSLDGVLNLALSAKSMAPFDPILVQCVTDFSKSILLDKSVRAFPELVVLANFFKSSNIAKLKQALQEHGSVLRLARGLVFHLAPSNVDSVFLYSSLLSFLCGNVNLIRISQQSSPQIDFILHKLDHLLSNTHPTLADRFFVMTYPHDDEVTKRISVQCHMRVVWGGDATVKKIRSLELRPTATEICFPDRFSAAMLHASSLLNLDEAELSSLASRFYNDAIWFSQQACSSPRLLAWIGEAAVCEQARQRFWDCFQKQLSGKNFDNSGGMVMDRFVSACMVATTDLHLETSTLEFPTRILLSDSPLGDLKHFHCGNGFFFEQFFDSMTDFFGTLTDTEQTLAVFGFDSNQIISNLHHAPMRSIDRVTSIGHALDFNHVWDGINLLNAFTRYMDIQL